MKEYRDINTITEEMNPMPTPCELAAENDILKQKVAALCKERDEWKMLGSLANKRAEDYREMRRKRDEAIKERDAAIADLKSCCAYNSDCAFCKHYFSDDAAQFCEEGDSCGNWEWRGVQEVQNNG